ncbi:hypothetical protein [Paenibacillus validus]|uniref:DNA-binding protein n=1 Tax=Paenibacillus validus TaxID=44253 RepID=A0A7X3CTU7_9BACL|nr:hypothetical protein [Paenibacillus validus]MUG73210.1 hypothetical protein [Paenibacillus validus]
MRKYTLSEISSLLTKASPTKVYSMQRIWSWCQNEGLRYETIPNAVRGVAYKPVWIREDELKGFLQTKGFGVEAIFSAVG